MVKRQYADLKLELVEGDRQRGVSSDLVDKFATARVFKHNAAHMLTQSEGQEGCMQRLL